MALIGDKEFFKGVGKINYEGPDSDNPLAFKYYNPELVVAGKTLREHFKFAVAYWHSFCGVGADPFGAGTQIFPWDQSKDPFQAAKDKADAAFEFISKIGFDYFCFHDYDLIQEADTLSESEDRLNFITDYIKEKKKNSGIKLLWGTANCFSNPHYMNGAATNPDFTIVTYAASQVKAALDATISLGGDNYVFWGGREGYSSLLNTNMKKELDHLAIFLSKARDYGRANGFNGTFLIEPKPMEPSKHQYDFDVAAVVSFLKHYDLENDFKINIENNHATLAGHTFAHEIQTAYNFNAFGSLDINQGDPHNGWDTDEFLNNIYDAVHIMLIILNEGGLKSGGMNFDAKTRRSSTDLEDIFIGHIHAMDTLARGLMIADDILQNSEYQSLKNQRYKSFDGNKGLLFSEGKLNLEEIASLASSQKEPSLISGKQELFESIINKHIK